MYKHRVQTAIYNAHLPNQLATLTILNLAPCLRVVLVVGVALGLAADIVLEVLVVVADDVARRVVLADDVVAIGALGPTTADALGALPHKLGKVTRVAVEAGLVEVVLGALVAPEVGPAVRGRPAAAPGDVFTVRVVGLLHKHCQ